MTPFRCRINIRKLDMTTCLAVLAACLLVGLASEDSHVNAANPVVAASPGVAAGSPAELAAAARDVERISAHRGASLDRPENTIAAFERAIEAGATAIEIDVRTSRDGKLVIMHDARVDRTTDGTGRVNDLTWAELSKLDAGSWFGADYASERVPSLDHALQFCRGRIDIHLDLKELGPAYVDRVTASVQAHGDPTSTIAAVRTVEQARQLKQRVPEIKTLMFLRQLEQIDMALAAKVDYLRPQLDWLAESPELLGKLREGGAKIHLDATTGTPKAVLPLLGYRPESLLCDDPEQLRKTLTQLQAAD
ncbi:glycerophosphodiester phosphodiesterase [Allorhodopirellula heiligendammensis]|uniref:Glycerophosphoryl diester phosphodiesterase n=1 Tax=Allorhodopirellula heiligendammensis TaxID=2714739 RepID=A0A5C6BUR5_9BACT|nr:glycerophosphodiester phosphodiesterase family protein [Allorhodopirellula heiligendammensis]TWU15397.1 Glycerophosphoryl diester phosphodiesterase [Allorhodopirellula heiligendammensis]